MARVQAQPNRRAVQHPFDLLAGLHHRADVRVQHRQHAAVGRGVCEPVEVGQQCRPLRVVESRSCVISLGTRRGGQHKHIGPARHDRIQRCGDIGQRIVVRIVQHYRGELAHAAQTVGVQQCGQLGRLGRQKTLRPKLRRGHSDIAHLGEHTLGRELISPSGYLTHTPGDRSTSNFHRVLTSSSRTGTPRFNDSVAASASQATSTASSTVHAGAALPFADIDEGRELRTERLGEAVHEEVVRGALGKVVGGIDISHRRTLVPAGDHGVMEAVHLEPAVVAVAVVAGRRDHAEGARFESHHHGGGVDVTELG